ncbi:hydrophobic protein [Streptomyces cacaoi]|uniref:Hydrophobic protein n=2 Tax=Streptomyces TaxID=1883 RepID=A0A6M4WTA3_9ACTN|nr:MULTISPECIES: hydrophobic protein [Streptomyces]MDQ0581938.1 phosphoglycerol transferase MdoB-like AlkP superfamily enzyme [Streptomyces rishiriensis]QJT02585.1 hydrophobic protein [Streptomyces asoensis]
MVPLLLVLLLALILFGAGFALKALWWIAVIVLVVWLVGFVARPAGHGGRKGRWYRW